MALAEPDSSPSTLSPPQVARYDYHLHGVMPKPTCPTNMAVW